MSSNIHTRLAKLERLRSGDSERRAKVVPTKNECYYACMREDTRHFVQHTLPTLTTLGVERYFAHYPTSFVSLDKEAQDQDQATIRRYQAVHGQVPHWKPPPQYPTMRAALEVACAEAGCGKLAWLFAYVYDELGPRNFSHWLTSEGIPGTEIEGYIYQFNTAILRAVGSHHFYNWLTKLRATGEGHSLDSISTQEAESIIVALGGHPHAHELPCGTVQCLGLEGMLEWESRGCPAGG